jgi:hypothetical protein
VETGAGGNRQGCPRLLRGSARGSEGEKRAGWGACVHLSTCVCVCVFCVACV